MPDIRLFTELSKDEKEVLLEELKILKLSCSPANMTVEEIEKLIASAKNAETTSTETANVFTPETEEQPSESDNSIIESIQPEETVVAASTVLPSDADSKSVQPQENKSQQKTKKKTDKGAVYNGICIACREKVFNNECSGCGRKY